MTNEPKRRMRFGTSPVTLALLAGWVVVVVVGAGRRPDDAPLLGVDNLGMVFFGVLVLVALLGLVLIIYLRPQDPAFVERKKPPQPWLMLAALLVLLLWRPNLIDVFNDVADQVAGEVGGLEEEVGAAAPAPPAEPVAQATDLLLLVLGVATVGGVWFLARRRTAPFDQAVEPAIDEQLEEEMLVAMDKASMELALGGDPRTAVLNAYASLERVLATRERRRRPAETPTEHLHRSLATLRVDQAPIVQLGALYELARFSEQDISLDQQHEARAALDRARQELAELA